jgi:dipeptidyl aminopeptidase/acylaminoacyl peptidase
MRFSVYLLVLLLPVATVATQADTAALSADIARMARIGSCFSPSLAPDGRTIAFITNISGSPQIWTVPATGGWPTQITAFNDQVNGVSWSPAGDWLAFSMAPGGGLNNQIYLIRPDGTGLKQLTPGGKVNCNLYNWSDDGHYLAFGTNERDAAAVDAYLHEVATGKSRLVRQARGIGRLENLSPDNTRAVVSELASRGRNNLYLLDLKAGTETLLTPYPGPGAFDAIFARNGRSLFLLGNQGRERVALFRIALDASGRPGEPELMVARDDAELSGITLDHAGRRAALNWNAGGSNEVVLLDLATGRSGPPLALPAEIAAGFGFSRDDTQLVFTASGSRRPADVWLLDAASGAVRQVTHAPHAGVDLEALVAPRLVKYPAHDGLELSAWLYVPRDFRAPGRVVMSYHGGPEGQERPAFNSTYQALLAQGIAVIAPNVRGSAGFGKTFVNLDNGALRVNGVRDIAATLDYLQAGGLADPKRVGIMGGSYGGYMVMAGVTEFPDRIAAGVNLFGVVNFETFFRHSEPWMAAISTVEYGNPATEAAMLRSLSPIHRMDRVKAPVLVQHGRTDTNVPFVEAEQVVAALKARNVPTELVEFPDEGHGFRKTPNRIRSATTLVEWFIKYL